MLHLLWSIIVGFFVGLIARGLLPGADHMGFWATVGVGIVGSLIGALLLNGCDMSSLSQQPSAVPATTAARYLHYGRIVLDTHDRPVSFNTVHVSFQTKANRAEDFRLEAADGVPLKENGVMKFDRVYNVQFGLEYSFDAVPEVSFASILSPETPGGRPMRRRPTASRYQPAPPAVHKFQATRPIPIPPFFRWASARLRRANAPGADCVHRLRS